MDSVYYNTWTQAVGTVHFSWSSLRFFYTLVESTYAKLDIIHKDTPVLKDAVAERADQSETQAMSSEE